MYSGYDYGNARLRAMKSRLFTRQSYEEMARLNSVDGLIGWLARSPYSPETERALARCAGLRAVNEACRLRIANVMRKVISFFSGDAARLVGVMAAQWDLRNLKTILRGQEGGLTADKIEESLVPAGRLDDAALKTLARQSGVAETAALLHTWNSPLADAVNAAQAARLKTNDWSAFEAALDARFYEELLGRLDAEAENDRLVLEFLARHIDVLNIVTAIRLRRASSGLSEEFFQQQLLKGGALGRTWLVALITTGSNAEVLGLLRESKFGGALSEIEDLDATRVQSSLERDLAVFSLRFFERDPLTIATVIGFIAAQKVEVGNVRLIAQAAALGLGRAEFEKELIIQ